MAITVGSYVFDERTTSARETYEAVGGKETRVIEITGLLRGVTDQAGLATELDAIMHASSEASPAYVSVRAGRRMLARREGFSREVSRQGLTGQFVLTMRADAAHEESESAQQVPWSIVLSGATIGLNNEGNAVAYPVVTLETLGTIQAPQLSDGVRTLAYDGLIEAGSILVFDGEAGAVWLDGVDITTYTMGEFPQLASGGSVLTYSDDPASSHLIDGEVTFRDRWW